MQLGVKEVGEKEKLAAQELWGGDEGGEELFRG